MPRVSGSTCLKYSVGTGKVCLGENPEDSEIEEVECKKKVHLFVSYWFSMQSGISCHLEYLGHLHLM